MSRRGLISYRPDPGVRKCIDIAKLLLERDGDQDVMQALMRDKLRDLLRDPRYQDRLIELGVSRQEALDALDADLKARVSA